MRSSNRERLELFSIAYISLEEKVIFIYIIDC